MADSAHSTSYEPKQLDKLISVESDTTPINDQDRDNISDFSSVTRECTRLISVPTACGPTSVSHVSCGNVALPKESQPRDTVRRQREKERKEKAL